MSDPAPDPVRHSRFVTELQVRPDDIDMNRHVHNLVYEYQQNLEYQHNKHIRITTWQKIAFLPSKELDVKILLRSNN